MLFEALLDHVIRDASIEIVDWRGRTRRVGSTDPPGCTIRVNRRGVDLALALNPELKVPEAYMEGTLTIEEGTLQAFIEICARNLRHLENSRAHHFKRLLDPARFGQRNGAGRALRNVAHHYDLSDSLYALFLDRDRQYSCAYFTDDTPDLDSAQAAKKRHLASKLLLRPGIRVLDIGSGWGGLALYLAAASELSVTGVTLSREQHAVAMQRAEEGGVREHVEFRLRDYREEEGPYDRIVSVGMFEHVGKRNYREFFAKTKELLADDGVMLLHTIGRSGRPAPINPYIRKYIFPGADLPSLSEVTTAIESSGLVITDVELLRLHYAETLKCWRERFAANRTAAAALYDERFCRMWEIYLLMCEMGFRYADLTVFQLQIAKRVDAVPLTRDYIYEWERNRRRGAQREEHQHAA